MGVAVKGEVDVGVGGTRGSKAVVGMTSKTRARGCSDCNTPASRRALPTRFCKLTTLIWLGDLVVLTCTSSLRELSFLSVLMIFQLSRVAGGVIWLTSSVSTWAIARSLVACLKESTENIHSTQAIRINSIIELKMPPPKIFRRPRLLNFGLKPSKKKTNPLAATMAIRLVKKRTSDP